MAKPRDVIDALFWSFVCFIFICLFVMAWTYPRPIEPNGDCGQSDAGCVYMSTTGVSHDRQ